MAQEATAPRDRPAEAGMAGCIPDHVLRMDEGMVGTDVAQESTALRKTPAEAGMAGRIPHTAYLAHIHDIVWVGLLSRQVRDIHAEAVWVGLLARSRVGNVGTDMLRLGAFLLVFFIIHSLRGRMHRHRLGVGATWGDACRGWARSR